jgi:hypothetical protein
MPKPSSTGRLQNNYRSCASTTTWAVTKLYLLLLRQLSLHVWAWLSHTLWQGAPYVVGQTRLQESFWLAQLAMQASLAASARRHFPIETLFCPAAAVPISSRDNTAQSASFMEISDYTALAAKRRLRAAAARTFAAGIRLANHELLDLVTGL